MYRVSVNIDELSLFGQKQEEFLPQLVSSLCETKEQSLLDVTVEINPLDKLCNQRIQVNTKPIKVIYDAQTINKVLDVFKIPDETIVDQ